MKNPRKITRIHLPVNKQDIPALIGISTSDPDYKLTLRLNKKLNISLRNTEPLRCQDNTDNDLFFSRFSYYSETNNLTIQLISNRYEQNYLLRKLVNIDFLILIHDPSGNSDNEKLLTSIRELESVTGAFLIDLNQVKDRNLKYLF
ncbi:MAG: IPExxxVDY family protein [Bacteroidales bacterium]|jgi:hypothetical protein|nr:IPExxxVDY family protein [Bacteroidales bacterium]